MSGIPGLAGLWRRTLGDESVCVAVVDGQADLDHPAFDGAALWCLGGVWPDDGTDGDTAAHGTHVASVIFGQHGSTVAGIAPRCRGLVVPAFSRRRGRTSQLELARGIELAVDAGAQVINVSGGQLSASGEAEDALARAVRFGVERGVLVVAAAGNDGCFCTHVPAALPGVLAVGALDGHGVPLAVSNWGAAYRRHGIMAPGQDVLGARAGGGTVRATGTSLAAPIVAGVAGLLLSLQRQAGVRPDPLAVGAALLRSADSCDVTSSAACERFLTGTLNIEGAARIVTSATNETSHDSLLAAPATPDAQRSCSCDGAERAAAHGGSPAVVMSAEKNAAPTAHPVYAIGVLGYDFGSERDGIRSNS
ncbi:S8 family serine peptidase [Amycolatopsis sp. NPDC059090]|uniref:S8 family serine peptidase n=1 Tax=unclassified Amycolatopsis TaxID=2618356 RepID=UPI00366AF46A